MTHAVLFPFAALRVFNLEGFPLARCTSFAPPRPGLGSFMWEVRFETVCLTLEVPSELFFLVVMAPVVDIQNGFLGFFQALLNTTEPPLYYVVKALQVTSSVDSLDSSILSRRGSGLAI